jgi:hypothetical protein
MSWKHDTFCRSKILCDKVCIGLQKKKNHYTAYMTQNTKLSCTGTYTKYLNLFHYCQ